MTVGEYKELNIKIAAYMGWETVAMESECGSCGTRIVVGESARHDKSYNLYCDNNECGSYTEGVFLEPCWWGEEYRDSNDLSFQWNWHELFLVLKKFDEDGKYTDALKLAVIKGDIDTVYKTVCESI